MINLIFLQFNFKPWIHFVNGLLVDGGGKKYEEYDQLENQNYTR